MHQAHLHWFATLLSMFQELQNPSSYDVRSINVVPETTKTHLSFKTSRFQTTKTFIQNTFILHAFFRCDLAQQRTAISHSVQFCVHTEQMMNYRRCLNFNRS